MAPTVLLFGDSLSFHGPDGPHPSDDPRIWPNLAMSAVGGQVELFAGFGWTARDAYWSLVGDPRVWTVVPHVDILVLAVGGMDTLPSPLPTYLRLGIRYLRPDGLRRRVREAYLAAQPWLARVTRGRPVALSAPLSVRYLNDIVVAIRALRPDLPVVVMLPSVHRAAAYGNVHTGRERAVAMVSAWAARSGVNVFDVAEVVRAHVLGGHGNPDGMHWGWDGHRLVGAAMADLLVQRGLVVDPAADN
ncbi:SGNH/GDSL hydrolase family protein [Actinokineospora auranticolor]|uniref:GDSL-like lipase/acylhydrolase family protein n=1 Tax=Actinokineospora auranticolor TaxID=155976 RepID=A0A2S6GV34_9PSEU|nr:diglucosylglycerate octanoyltransferase [Actinokineospora auranticolor]PPK69074.1 GDSL-like lipase/acylhydrolase family protein [Actinokineospora auranticolor]